MPPAASILLDEQLCFPLYTAGRLMTRTYAEQLGPEGLTYPQYLVLLVLWEDERLSVGDLGARLQLESGTLTPLLKRLEAAGLVDRVRDIDDERRVLIGLTAAGRALETRLATVPEAVRPACGLTDAEIATLKGLLERLGAHLTAGLAGAHQP